MVDVTAVANAMSFQEKVKERIQSSIGDLMTDEDLKKLVDAAMHDAFFKPITSRSQYGGETQQPPFFITLIREELSSKIEKYAKEYIESNAPQFAEIIKEHLDVSFVQAVTRSFNTMFQNDLYQLQNSIFNKLQSLR